MSEKISEFAFCTCFLSRNIFLSNLALHVNFENVEKFRADYHEQIPESQIQRCIKIAKNEIQRRKILRSNILNRMKLLEHYTPLHPDVYKFDASNVISEKNEPKCIGKDVFSMRVFKPNFCDRLLEELKNFKTSGIPHEQPNSMNRHGVILDEIGFQKFVDDLRTQFIQPWARKLYGDENLELDSHKAFVVKYAMNEGEYI